MSVDSMFDNMPHLVLELISRTLLSLSDNPQQTMADIALTCQLPSFMFMMETIHELVDPGCVAAARTELRNRESSVQIARSEIDGFAEVLSQIGVPEHITQSSRAAILKSHCKDLGAPCCGSKQAMWASILIAVQAQRLRAEHRHMVMMRVADLPPICRWICPIRSRVRLLLRALQHPVSIHAKHAMVSYGLTRAVVDNIPRIHWASRVHKLEHVLQASIAQHGESHDKFTDTIERVTRECDTEREAQKKHEEHEESKRMRRQQLESILIKHGISESDLNRALGYDRSRDCDQSLDDSSDDEGDCDPPNIHGSQTIAMFLEGSRPPVDVAEVEFIIMESLVIHERLSELNCALAAAGCEIEADSAICNDYIAYDHGTVHEIVETMREMKWYVSHTEYEKMADSHRNAMIHEARGTMYGGRYNIGRYRYGRIRFDANKLAKETAMTKWLAGYNDISVAISQPDLPPSIVQELKNGHAYQIALNRFSEALSHCQMNLSSVLSQKCAQRFAHEVSCSAKDIVTDEYFDEYHAPSMRHRISKLRHKYDMISAVVERDGSFHVDTIMRQFSSEQQFLLSTDADILSRLARLKKTKRKRRMQKKK